MARLAICIGHDANRQGAVGNEGKSEFNFNSNLIRDMFFEGLMPDKHEYRVFYRSADIKGYTAKMRDLHKRIDEFGADVSIEVHFNGSSNPSVNGFEALYYSQGGKVIADKLVKAFSDNLPTNNRGSKKLNSGDNGYGFVSKGNSYCVISEPYFSLHQDRFVFGGDLREPLKKALTEFFNSL